ncbi:MAG: hypothetical protein Fur005_46720 [Roseiflexaceae bacterium]
MPSSILFDPWQQLEDWEARSEQNPTQVLAELRAAQQVVVMPLAPDIAHEWSLLETILLVLLDDYERALDVGLRAIQAFDQDRQDRRAARFLHALGRTYAMVGAFDQALSYLNRAELLAKILPDPVTEGSVYLSLSLIYSRIGQLQEADEAIHRALAMPNFEQLPDGLRADLLHDLAWEYSRNGATDLALHVISQVIALKADPWNLSTYALILGASGDLHGQRQVLEEAYAALKPHEHQQAFVVKNEFGTFLLKHGEPERGVQLLHEALEMTVLDQLQHQAPLETLIAYAVEHADFRAAYEYQLRLTRCISAAADWQLRLRNRALNTELQIQLAQRERSAQQDQVRITQQAYEEQQRLVELINEISTPLLLIGDEILILPMIGSLNSYRIERMISDVLHAVAERRTRALILDISGVPLVDTQVGSAILQLDRSVSLLGCRCVLVGIRPEIAQTLVSIGTNLSELTTCATIMQGLTAVGVRLVRH